MVFAIQDFSILDGVEDLDIPDLSQRDHQGIQIHHTIKDGEVLYSKYHS